MSRLIAAALVLVCAAGCSRCGKKPASPDAGQTAASASVHGAIVAIDLRSALFVIYPEFSGTEVKGGEARLTRSATWGGDLAATLPSRLRGFSDAHVVDGTVRAKRPPFELEARRTDGEVALAVALPLDTSTVGRLIQSPSPMGTEDLSLMLPRLPGEKDARELFELRLEYKAKPARTTFLVRQLVSGLTASGWRSDTDGGELPSDVEVTLTNAEQGARIEVKRHEDTVKLHYVQPIARR